MTVANEPSRVEVIYMGPVGTHLVPSPTRKVANYGLHTRGDVFLVHTADQEQAPTKFILVNPVVADVIAPPVPQQTPLPPAPEKVAIKAPEPIEVGAFVTKEVEEDVVEATVEDAPAKAKAPATKAKPVKETK